LLRAVTQYRRDSLEVEIFALFLSNQFDAVDLMFYLFARSRVFTSLTEYAVGCLNLMFADVVVTTAIHPQCFGDQMQFRWINVCRLPGRFLCDSRRMYSHCLRKYCRVSLSSTSRNRASAHYSCRNC